MITDMISTAPGFQTSVNISYDLNNSKKIKSLIPTSTAVSLFEDFLLSTDNSSTNRAKILIGAYGKGKQIIKSNKVVDIINLLYKYPAISTSIVAKEADIPPVTATRYLNALEECRIVYSDKRPKNRTYYYYGVLEIIR